MNDAYLVLDIPENIKSIFGIQVEVHSKDQTWASVSINSS